MTGHCYDGKGWYWSREKKFNPHQHWEVNSQPLDCNFAGFLTELLWCNKMIRMHVVMALNLGWGQWGESFNLPAALVPIATTTATLEIKYTESRKTWKLTSYPSNVGELDV